MSTAAERQRRSRAHRKGDHSLCDPLRCDGTLVPPPVTRDPGLRMPPMAARGRRMWHDLTEGTTRPNPGQLVLIEEACRIADRLDRLDAHLRGDEDAWLRFHARNEDGSIVEVVIDKALGEARQQAVALKQLVAELRQSQAPVKASKAAAAATGPGVASGVSDLTARIRERRTQAQG